jgi:hypothetical protein
MSSLRRESFASSIPLLVSRLFTQESVVKSDFGTLKNRFGSSLPRSGVSVHQNDSNLEVRKVGCKMEALFLTGGRS